MDAAPAAAVGAPTDDLSGSLFDVLPNEVVAHTLGKLSCADQRLRASLVCHRWHDILRAPPSARAATCFVLAADAREGLLRAACCGHVDCVARLCARGAPYDRVLYDETIQKDDVAVLQVLGIREDALDAASMVSLCAQYASARCLAYALAQYKEMCIGSLSLWWRCDKADPIEHAACWAIVCAAGHRIAPLPAATSAAASGHVQCLRLALSGTRVKGAALAVTHAVALSLANLDCLRLLCELASDGMTCNVAAARGRVDALCIMREYGVAWGATTCAAAAANNHLDCLRYAHDNGCPWDETTCLAAIENGSLDCLRYACANGCVWSRRAITVAINGRTARDRIEYLRCLCECDPSCGAAVCNEAAASGALDCLRYAHKSGFHWDGATCAKAARYDEVQCLAYAHENGCTRDERTLLVAIHHDALNCVRYMHTRGVRWSRRAYAKARRIGAQCFEYMASVSLDGHCMGGWGGLDDEARAHLSQHDDDGDDDDDDGEQYDDGDDSSDESEYRARPFVPGQHPCIAQSAPNTATTNGEEKAGAS